MHFLGIGALLFAIYSTIDAPDAAAPRRIELTPDDLRQISVAWLAQGRPEPTREEMEALVESRVREEVLYREALALGFDKDDTIVRRRLAQKMEFLTEDLAKLREPPTRAELETWFAANAQQFTRPALLSFRHLYFSPDRRGAQARADAERALARLDGKPLDAANAGDPFMFQDFYGERTREEIARDFGAPFADALSELPTALWQGPIESGYGWHLVFVDAATDSTVPGFDQVEPEVLAAWTAEQREILKRAAYEEMRARYEVVLPAAAPPSP